MEKELESMLIEYIDGTLGEQDKRWVEEELRTNPAVKVLHMQLVKVVHSMRDVSELQPGEALKRSFDHFLSQEVERFESKQVKMFPTFYRIAAGIIMLMIVGITAYWVRKDMQNQERLAEMERELEESKQMMRKLLDNEYSASQRMQGVSVAYEINMADEEIVGILVKTLNSDPNTNVRLAALDALSKFTSEEKVRKSLIESLSTQKDPVIQIALIQLMVKMKEKTVIRQLEKMTKDSKTMKAVKDEAYSGIFRLS